MESRRTLNPASLTPGMEVGPWRIVSLRGRGTYGSVYCVQKVGTEDSGPFALKLAHHPRNPRFEREVELLSRIHHPHVPRLHDHGWWMGTNGGGFPYLVMDWIEGVPLYEWAAHHKPSYAQRMRLLAQLARALEATHAAECVHRDVKGDNVLMRTADDRVMLVDFGSGDFRGARTLTHDPLPPGTPQYRSPEALRFELTWRRPSKDHYEAGPADDMYALGVIAFRLATGTYPPMALDAEETEEGYRPFSPPLVLPENLVTACPELAGLIRQMLSADPSARGTAGEVAQALERAVETSGPPVLQRMASRMARGFTSLGSRAGSPRRPRGWPAWLKVAAAGVPLAVSAWWVLNRRGDEIPEGGCELLRSGSTSALDTVNVGETALTVSSPVEPPEPKCRVIELEMPKRPFRGQRRPPCKAHAVEINEGCWIRLADAKPPCGEDSFDWNDNCYLPLLKASSAPSSLQPEP
jgi:hypothetical protein